MKRIIISGGYYATNIGNAFYEIGAKYVLNKCLSDRATVELSSNKLDIYWSRLTGARAGLFDLTNTYEADYVVILGPTLSVDYLSRWEDTFSKLSAKGTRFVFMSTGASRYDDKEYEGVSAILKRFKFYALLSRDEKTYELYKDCFEHSYNGICCALYCADYAPKRPLDLEPYVIFNFDNCREPVPVPAAGGIEICNNTYDLKKAARLSKAPLPERLASGETIIRTIHTVMPGVVRRNLKGSNYYISDVPYDYLTLYAHASAVLTNRVHAAVASVSYGTPVHLTNATPRGNILKRIGAQAAYKEMYRSDAGYLESEKRKYEDAIREIFQ